MAMKWTDLLTAILGNLIEISSLWLVQDSILGRAPLPIALQLLPSTYERCSFRKIDLIHQRYNWIERPRIYVLFAAHFRVRM